MRVFINSIMSGEPLYAEPARMSVYIDKVRSIEIPSDAKAGSVKEMMEMMFGKRPESRVDGDVAIIPLKGVIGKGLTEMEKMMGMTDIDDFTYDVLTAAASPEIKHVHLDIDSPGGSVIGLDEAASAVRSLRAAGKTSRAATDCEMLSAAYYVGSQADEVVATASAKVGSVGVFKIIPDTSKAYEMEGVKMNVIKAGKFKAVGAPGSSMTDEQMAYEQESVNNLHREFKETVKSVRAFVKDEDMEGQIFTGKVAAQKHMVTGLAKDGNLFKRRA